MPKQNFKSQAKRKRELAKLGKRAAKDQKRASRRTDTPEPGVAATTVSLAGRVAAGPAERPRTLAEAVERWKNTKVVSKPR